MTEEERQQLQDEMASRGWPSKREVYDGDLVLTVRDGKPGRLIIKSRFEAIAAGCIPPPGCIVIMRGLHSVHWR